MSFVLASLRVLHNDIPGAPAVASRWFDSSRGH